MAETLVGVLSSYDSVVEVGVGNRQDLAVSLAEHGVSVTVTDIVSRDVPSSVEFVVDDVLDPDIEVYEGTDAVFARRLPPELQRAVVDIARNVDAACVFTTLGSDPAVVPVEPRTVESGTLYVARE